MLRMTPGQSAEGVWVATALGSFDLTVRGVRENAIRRVGTVELANGRRPACPAPRPQPASCNALTFANIVGSHFGGGGAKCSDGATFLRQMTTTLRSIQWIRHDTSPKEKATPDRMSATGQTDKSLG